MDRLHDPGVEPARKRGEEAAKVADKPIKVGRRVARFGTASWTDPTMTAPGVFYPKGSDSAEERLRFYASQFPVVEVDATYYALPYKRMAEAWADRTPKNLLTARALAASKIFPCQTTRAPFETGTAHRVPG